MESSFIFDKTSQLLGKALDVSARRHRLLTTNLANVDTVGYRPRDLDFRQALDQELQKPPAVLHKTHPSHLGRQEAPAKTGAVREGAESVDIDIEMTHLAQNNIQYRTSAEMLLRKIGILKNAIVEGGR